MSYKYRMFFLLISMSPLLNGAHEAFFQRDVRDRDRIHDNRDSMYSKAKATRNKGDQMLFVVKNPVSSPYSPGFGGVPISILREENDQERRCALVEQHKAALDAESKHRQELDNHFGDVERAVIAARIASNDLKMVQQEIRELSFGPEIPQPEVSPEVVRWNIGSGGLRLNAKAITPEEAASAVPRFHALYGEVFSTGFAIERKGSE